MKKIQLNKILKVFIYFNPIVVNSFPTIFLRYNQDEYKINDKNDPTFTKRIKILSLALKSTIDFIRTSITLLIMCTSSRG